MKYSKALITFDVCKFPENNYPKKSVSKKYRKINVK